MAAGQPQGTARERLQTLARRELRSWSGLIRPTTLDDVAVAFDLDRSWHAGGWLGQDRRQASWLAASGDGYPEGLRVWTVDDEVALIDAPDVELAGNLEALLDALGPPEAELASYLGTLLIDRSERVYTRHGLTLYVNPENRLLLRVAVYAPSTLEEYERSLRLDLRMIRLPLRPSVVEEDSR